MCWLIDHSSAQPRNERPFTGADQRIWSSYASILLLTYSSLHHRTGSGTSPMYTATLGVSRFLSFSTNIPGSMAIFGIKHQGPPRTDNATVRLTSRHGCRIVNRCLSTVDSPLSSIFHFDEPSQMQGQGGSDGQTMSVHPYRPRFVWKSRLILVHRA